MGFRDDNEALRQRVAALTDEVEDLRGELDEARAPEPEPAPLPKPPPAPPGADLATRAAAAEAQRVHALEERKRKLLAAQKRVKSEWVVAEGDGVACLTLHRGVLSHLRRNVDASFSFLAPSLLPLVGLAHPVFDSVPYLRPVLIVGWIALVVVGAAHVLRPRITLRVEGPSFELQRVRSFPLVGETRHLHVDPSPPHEIGRGSGPYGGRLRITHKGHTVVDVGGLSRADAEDVRRFMGLMHG